VAAEPLVPLRQADPAALELVLLGLVLLGLVLGLLGLVLVLVVSPQ